VSVEPPERSRWGGRAPIHSPEVIASIADVARDGWASNGLEYASKTTAVTAAQRVKTALVKQGHFSGTRDLQSTVYSKDGDDGPYVFALRAR
jgi:hypothetical protein